MKLRPLLMALGSASFLVNCGDPSATSVLDTYEIPQEAVNSVVLGQAFDTDRYKMLNVTCITGDSVKSEIGEVAEIDLSIGLGFEETLKKIGGKISVNLEYPAVRAGAGAEYAMENSSTNVSNSFLFTWSNIKRRQILRTNSYELTPTGKNIRDNRNSQLQTYCGNEFVKEIEYGAKLFINMKVDYANEFDKEEIGGKLDLAVGEGGIDIFKLEGELEMLDQARKSSVNISIQARQVGGDSLQLLTIIPDSLVTCSLENPKPCFKLFNDAIRYAKTNVVQQLSDPNRYKPIKYITERYDESGAFDLVPNQGYQQLDLLVREKRRDIERKYTKELLNKQRATDLLVNYSRQLSSSQKSRVQSIEDLAFKNAEILSGVSISCYDTPKTCIAVADRELRRIRSYNEKDLKLESFGNLNPVSFQGWQIKHPSTKAAFSTSQADSGSILEDYDGFSSLSETGETVHLSTIIREASCSDVAEVENNPSSQQYQGEVPFKFLVEHFERRGKYTLRAIGAFRSQDRCMLVTFYSQNRLSKKVDFNEISPVSTTIKKVFSTVK
ncbi:hypothetical protein [Pseudobacteriovorax antillogorgiicola]|uniref:Lipoprotein n=1 Tax=Pseudobacteriovorax antillogorgiicola TaxID=1513793 RepID=A0A1Y6B6U9_9BACT|nr:hypothetical protein [Pseudobacteriovorax antillogorgiicola]TCS58745.1 hypothetical protein EDD56_102259 [Pseudobacteriovorax antillogorgiicola]SME95217.1 hypothetical protein SAMN06296036_102184 [Pseudobacteriovorax antillogorgiicola]